MNVYMKYLLLILVGVSLSCGKRRRVVRFPIPRQVVSLGEIDIQPGETIDIFEKKCKYEIQDGSPSSGKELCNEKYMGEAQFIKFSSNSELVVLASAANILPLHLVIKKREDGSIIGEGIAVIDISEGP